MSFKQVFNNKLLVLVPSHFKGFFIGVYQIVNLLIVNLQEGKADFEAEPGVGLLFVLDGPEQVENASGNETFVGPGITLNGECLS
jgi:hypothetical protein